MWDFHSHILPGLDDGAKDKEESLKMAKIAVQEGIHTMVATPHYIPFGHETESQRIIKLVEKTNEVLKRENIPLTILPGMEVLADWEIIKAIDAGKILTLNSTRYILIELPMHDIPDYIEDLLFELEVRGLVPIIAHPERNRKIQKDPTILAKWVEKGILAQLNTISLLGILGQTCQETAETLLKRNMIHLLGSDAHTSGKRSPQMKEAISLMQSLTTPQQLEQILQQYPKEVLENKKVMPETPNFVEDKRRKKKKRFFFF